MRLDAHNGDMETLTSWKPPVWPSGDGFRTWPGRSSRAAERRVDVADGLCLNLKASWRFLHRSIFLTNAAVSCCSPQEGSSKVTMNQQEFSLSAGDSILVPEQTQWVDFIVTCRFGCIIGVVRVCWGHGGGHWILCCCSVEGEKRNKDLQIVLLYVFNGNKSKLVCPPPCADTSGRDTRGPSPCLWSKILSGRDPKHCQDRHSKLRTHNCKLTS